MKLAKLPERVLVKLSLRITPELDQALNDYAAYYAATYGQHEPVTELVPAILATFLDADRDFGRQAKVTEGNGATSRGRDRANRRSLS